MFRRIAVAASWFVSAWMAYALVAYFLGLPDGGGGVVGALVAAFVFMDPTGQLWTRADRPATEATSAQLTSQTDSQTAASSR